MESGIYQIRNQTNGKCYVGSTVDTRRRWRSHLNCLRHGKHCNSHLQAAFDRYGESAFQFEILESAAPKNLVEREQHYLDAWEPEYNIALVATMAMLGRQHSEETKRKISEAHKGKHHSAETKHKMSMAKRGKRNPGYGKHRSVETRRKISEAHKGERNYLYGKHLSAETRAKMRAAWTPERREAQSKKMAAMRKAQTERKGLK